MDIGSNSWWHGLIRILNRCSFTRFLTLPRKLLENIRELRKHRILSRGFNVLIVVENMSYTYDTRVQNISNTLRKAGYHINVICPRYLGDPKKASFDGIDVCFYYLPSSSGGFTGYFIEYTYSINGVST